MPAPTSTAPLQGGGNLLPPVNPAETGSGIVMQSPVELAPAGTQTQPNSAVDAFMDFAGRAAGNVLLGSVPLLPLLLLSERVRNVFTPDLPPPELSVKAMLGGRALLNVVAFGLPAMAERTGRQGKADWQKFRAIYKASKAGSTIASTDNRDL